MSLPRPSCGLFDLLPVEVKEKIYEHAAANIAIPWSTTFITTPGNSSAINTMEPATGLSAGLPNANAIIEAEMAKAIDKHSEFRTTVVLREGAPASDLPIPRIPIHAKHIHLRVEMETFRPAKGVKASRLRILPVWTLAQAVGTGPGHVLVTFHFPKGVKIVAKHVSMIEQFERSLRSIGSLRGYKIQAFAYTSEVVASKEWAGKKVEDAEGECKWANGRV
ncbi:unnamed protein product [Zymoseptoria tritici ST99CH_3D7]|uniref:Uncharacterized protein n=1 Tax=Zymoseptoria tritici (strain ST99CH_3D7) TaxID=1276538 RepID=A0A1X7RZV4_ZYMT9|nr:unnamed protein product [Zymoseptoria tritici ST99CH_3D7]